MDDEQQDKAPGPLMFRLTQHEAEALVVVMGLYPRDEDSARNKVRTILRQLLHEDAQRQGVVYLVNVTEATVIRDDSNAEGERLTDLFADEPGGEYETRPLAPATTRMIFDELEARFEFLGLHGAVEKIQTLRSNMSAAQLDYQE